MPVEQVADLLQQWRDASGVFSRSRVLTQAVQALSGLSPDERRTLARALAEQGSPQLAAQVEDRTGGTVRANRFATVADGLLALEEDELDRLVAGLRDPDTRERLARETLEQATQGPPAPPRSGTPPAAPVPGARPGGAIDLGSLPPPGAGPDRRGPAAADQDGPDGTDPDTRPDAGDDPPADDRLAEVRAETRRLDALPDAGADRSEVSLGDGGVELATPDLVSPELGAQDLDDPSLEEISLVPSTVHEIEVEDTDLVEPSHPTEGRTATDDDPSAVDRDHDLDDLDDLDGGVDDLGGEVDDLDHDLVPDPEPADVPAEPTVGRSFRDRLRGATTATDRLAVVGAASAAGIGGEDALELLDGMPDGWQRRRAAERLAEAGRLPTTDLPALLRRFARTTDATFVAGALLAADRVTPDDLEGALPDRTLRRLRARTER